MSLLLLFSDQVAPTTGVFTATVSLETTTDVFVNVTADLMAGDTRRGKQRELDRYEAGVATVTLENSDRAYDPQNTAGPYYGNLLPNKRLSLTATYNGVTYPLFSGLVDRIRQVSTGPNTGVAVIEATDAFKWLERAELLSSAYAAEVGIDNPVHWWRLGEPAGSTVAHDAGSTPVDLPWNAAGTVTFGETGMVARELGTAVTMAGGAAFLMNQVDSISGAAFTIEAIVVGTAGNTARSSIFDQGGIFGLDLDNALISPVFSGLGLTSTTQYADGLPHHVVVTYDTTAVALYVDGDLEASGTFATAITKQPARVALGNPTHPIKVQELAVYNTALSAARVAAHYETIATPWDGDLPGERVNRVLDAIDWPAALRDVDTGSTSLLPATLATSALEHIQKVAESELGLVYVTREGAVRFESRDNLVDQPSTATVTDFVGSTPAIVYDEPEISDDLIRNRATISRLDGVAQTDSDAASIALNGPVDYVLDGLFHDSDEHSRHIAEYVVAEYKDARQRINALTISPRGNGAVLFPIALGLELSDWITVAQTPQGVGAQNSQLSVVEGISHTFGPKAWETTLQLSPAPGGATSPAYWSLGVAGYSELGQTTRLYV